jgi:hypothetical protein
MSENNQIDKQIEKDKEGEDKDEEDEEENEEDQQQQDGEGDENNLNIPIEPRRENYSFRPEKLILEPEPETKPKRG